MKLHLRHILILLAIVLFSILFGVAFDGVTTIIEKQQYPIENEFTIPIADYAKEFGVPEAIAWAVVRTESAFASNHVGEDGGIGLMQLTPKQFQMIATDVLHQEPENAGMLYDPYTNLRYGIAYLSHLYERYGVWETVYAAYAVGTDTVNEWLKNEDYVTSLGTLGTIPDQSANAYVREVSNAVSMYVKLYF